MHDQELYAALHAELAHIKDRQQQQRALRQLLHERPELREQLGVGELHRPTYRGKGAGQSSLLNDAGYAGDGRNMAATAKASSVNRAPWMAWNRTHMEPVTMDLTEATRRFPRAYGAASFYHEVG